MFTSARFAHRAGAVAGVATLLGFGLVAPAQAAPEAPVDSPAGSLQPAGDVPPTFGDPLTTQLCGVSGDCLATSGYLECHQLFQSGAVFWNELMGAHQVQGAIYQAWVNEDSQPARGVAPVNQLQPTTNEIPVADGVQQSFSYADQGRVVYFWSPQTGAHFVDADTAAGQYFLNNGGAEALGFPTGEVVTAADGSSVLQTSAGTIQADFGANGESAGSFTAL